MSMSMRMIARVVVLAVFHASATTAWAQSRPIPPSFTSSAIPASEPPGAPAYPPAPDAAPAIPTVEGTAGGQEPPPSNAPPPRTFGPAFRLNGPIIHLRADNPRARLQHLTLRWTDVCTSPCGFPVDPAGQYRVGGGSIKASPVFRLPPGTHSVQITASTGSVVKYWIGAGLAINGVVSLVMAAFFLGAQSNTTATVDNSAMRDLQHTYGTVYLVMGIVSLAVGLPMWLGNNTTVEVR